MKAIADIYLRQTPPKDVIGPLYEKADRDLPKNTSIIISNWRKAIQDKLDAEDPHMISLCKQNGVIEEGEPTRRGRRGR